MSKDNDNPAGKRRRSRRLGQCVEVGRDKYSLRVFLGRDSAGKRHYHSEIFHGGRKAAEDRIREIARRHHTGEALKANNDTLGTFLDEWLVAKRLSVEESSLTTYKNTIENYIRPLLGKHLLTRITAGDVESAYTKLRDDGLGLTTIRYVHNVLGMIFKLAVERKKLMGSPMVGVKRPKGSSDKRKDRAMTAEQITQFLSAATETRFENLFKLAFHLGCRPGELLALKWADLDADARTLRINQSINFRKSQDWYLKKPKSELSQRTLPLTQTQIEILRAQRRQQIEARLKAGNLWTDHGFIFSNQIGEPYPRWTLRDDFKLILKAAGLPRNLSPYSTRHSMATLLIAGGTNTKAVSERLGHSDVVITLRQYMHVSQGMQADVSEEIDRLLGGQK